VFQKILDPDGDKEGNPKLEDIDVVDDFLQPKGNQELYCACGDATAWTIPKHEDEAKHRTQMILCPDFWKHGTFLGGSPHRQWPGVITRTCNNIGNRVSSKMHTLGGILLHEYTHVEDLVQPPLSKHVEDPAKHFYESRMLALEKPEQAKSNADNYAGFAAELTWSTLCNRDFEAPFNDDVPAPRSVDNKRTDTKGTDNEATESKQQRPRHDVQLAPSLQKRTAFSQPYQYPIPNTNNKFNTYTVEEMDKFRAAHIDALNICSVVINEATRNPKRFDKIFREYFSLEDRKLVLGQFSLR
jgi:hypothetical protein